MTVGEMVGHGGRYRLVSRIATGGMGEVWRATDTVLERQVAIKLLKQELADDDTFRSRFEAEARNAAALQHPNVAAVFDFGETPTGDGSGRARPYLVMELVEGEPLSELLREGQGLDHRQAASLVAQAADGLAAAHALGIVHRDVKPANLIVGPGGGVHVTDFGIARAGDAVALTGTGQIIGTPHYISPEQAQGRTADASSDVYSLGVVLFECLAGRRPYEGDTPVAVALAQIREPVPPLPDEVPAELAAVVNRAMAKDPQERFHSAAEMAAALRAAAGFDVLAPTVLLPTSAPVAAAAGAGVAAGAATAAQDAAEAPDWTEAPATAVTPGPEGPHRAGWWAWASAAVAVLLLLLAAWVVLGDGSQEEAPATDRSPGASPSPEQVRVRAQDYVGDPLPRAREDLQELGLQVRTEPRLLEDDDFDAGTVAAVRPTGLLDVGDTVTLEVWRRPAESADDDDDDPGEDDDDDEGRGKDEKGPGGDKGPPDHAGKGKQKGNS